MPQPDNSRHLVASARRRAARTRERATTTLRRAADAGTPVTFDSIARQAGVSRSWLYAQPDLRAEIERLRTHSPKPTAPPVPDRQRASTQSLLRRLEVATNRVNNLEAENRQLRDALAAALGQRRANALHGDHDTPTR